MSQEYTHIVSSEDKTRKQLSFDLLDTGIDSKDIKLYRKFTAAAAKLSEKQAEELERKGYTVERNGQMSAPISFP